MSEGLTKIGQRKRKLFDFKVLILWRHMRGALPYVVYNFFRKCAFSHKDMHPFTCAFDTLSEIRFYTHTCTKKNHSVVKNRKKAIYRLILYTTYGRAPRTWRHKIKTLKSNNFLFLWPIFVKPSLICFFHLSLFIETKIISGWTSPLDSPNYYCS